MTLTEVRKSQMSKLQRWDWKVPAINQKGLVINNIYIFRTFGEALRFGGFPFPACARTSSAGMTTFYGFIHLGITPIPKVSPKGFILLE